MLSCMQSNMHMLSINCTLIDDNWGATYDSKIRRIKCHFQWNKVYKVVLILFYKYKEFISYISYIIINLL